MGPGTPSSPPTSVRSPDRGALAAGVVLILGTLAVYSQTFSVPLLFDDWSCLIDNASIRHLGNLHAVLLPPRNVGVGGRPLLNLSFALNYAVGGLGVRGYHAVNLLLHVLAALTLFGLVRRTLRRPRLAPQFGRAATGLALAVSALWAWDPVLTGAVTYIAQRAEVMMGLWYLLTLYCLLRGAEAAAARGRRGWFALAVISCLAGVCSKEVIATVPLAALLYDRTFLSGTFREAWRRHRITYLALAATWVPLGFLTTGLTTRGAGFSPIVSWWAYGLAEARVVVKYLLLCLWPRPLVFDYGSFVVPELAKVWPFLLIIAVLLAATVAAIRRAPAAGFAAAWFFLILAPTSSIVPVISQPMAENRLYLPLAGVVAAVVLGAFALWGGRILPVAALLAAVLAAATVERNRLYLSESGIWADAAAKLPLNPRAHSNLAAVWVRIPGEEAKAVAEYAAASRLEPTNGKAHYDLGFALDRAGRKAEAIAEFQEAVRLQPDLVDAHTALGNYWTTQPGRIADALAEYQRAAALKPDDAGVHNNLGNAWFSTPGRMNFAIIEYRKALRIDASFPEVHNNLGNALASQPGQLPAAIGEYRAALRLKPDYADAHMNLALALSRLPGNTAEERDQLEAVLRVKPTDPLAKKLLAALPAAPP